MFVCVAVYKYVYIYPRLIDRLVRPSTAKRVALNFPDVPIVRSVFSWREKERDTHAYSLVYFDEPLFLIGRDIAVAVQYCNIFKS